MQALRNRTLDEPGVTRASYGDGEQIAHDMMREWAREHDLEITHDFAGNQYMTLPGRDRSAPARGKPKLLNIGYHLRIAGRPARIATLTRVLDYLRRLGDVVWVARRDAIARLWRDQSPQPS